jgi:hypothetical protein
LTTNKNRRHAPTVFSLKEVGIFTALIGIVFAVPVTSALTIATGIIFEILITVVLTVLIVLLVLLVLIHPDFLL